MISGRATACARGQSWRSADLVRRQACWHALWTRPTHDRREATFHADLGALAKVGLRVIGPAVGDKKPQSARDPMITRGAVAREMRTDGRRGLKLLHLAEGRIKRYYNNAGGGSAATGFTSRGLLVSDYEFILTTDVAIPEGTELVLAMVVERADAKIEGNEIIESDDPRCTEKRKCKQRIYGQLVAHAVIPRSRR